MSYQTCASRKSPLTRCNDVIPLYTSVGVILLFSITLLLHRSKHAIIIIVIIITRVWFRNAHSPGHSVIKSIYSCGPAETEFRWCVSLPSIPNCVKYSDVLVTSLVRPSILPIGNRDFLVSLFFGYAAPASRRKHAQTYNIPSYHLYFVVFFGFGLPCHYIMFQICNDIPDRPSTDSRKWFVRVGTTFILLY